MDSWHSLIKITEYTVVVAAEKRKKDEIVVGAVAKRVRVVDAVQKKKKDEEVTPRRTGGLGNVCTR